MKGQLAVRGMGKWRRLRARNAQEPELCLFPGQERVETQRKAYQADAIAARSDAAELAMVVVWELWGGATGLARLAQVEEPGNEAAKPAQQVEVAER
jgi:hypothetical protein